MEDNFSFAVGALAVVVGFAQVTIMMAQKRHERMGLIASFQHRWSEYREHWGRIVFIGRNPGDFYQTVDDDTIKKNAIEVEKVSLNRPTAWALESAAIFFGFLAELSMRILEGNIYVTDAYPILGTQLLRHGKALRILLDTEFRGEIQRADDSENHRRLQTELQNWLIYHDGLRRRCLILIDLLWAEAAHMEDLPPHDIASAANRKKATGYLNRSRVFKEVIRLKGLGGLVLAWRLRRSLGRAEYWTLFNPIGIRKQRLNQLEAEWTRRLLRE